MAYTRVQLIGIGEDTVGGTSKTINDPDIKEDYKIVPFPLGALVNAGTLSVSDVSNGSFTIRSTNFLDSRQFIFLILKED